MCDGVSSSSDGALAANIGSAAALERARALMRTGEVARSRRARVGFFRAPRGVQRGERRRTRRRARSSRPPGPLAADRSREKSTAPPPPTQEPPGATIVVAVIRGSDLAIGWAGDSRAYLAPSTPPGHASGELLTHDHSWANAMLATGHVTEEEAFAQPMAYALTRCIGPLDDNIGDLVPEVRVATITPGATLVLCSDGVWSYLSRPEAMAAMIGCVRSRRGARRARARPRSASPRRTRQRERRCLRLAVIA